MPFLGILMPDKPPDKTVTGLTDRDMPIFGEILENSQNTARHIPRSCRVKFFKAQSQLCDKIPNLPQEDVCYK